MHIKGDINNNFEIFTPELDIYCHNLKTTGDLFACDGSLQLDADNLVEINARIGGKTGAYIRANKIKVLGKVNKTGVSAPNALYQRNGNGIYSERRVTLEIGEHIHNYYGIIQGMVYTITTPQLINCAGLIVADNPYSKSNIDVQDIMNVRDEETTYHTNRCRGHPSDSISPANRYHHDNLGWCGSAQGCNRGTCETSDEGVIFAQGDLQFTYKYLEMLASRITCGGNLTFNAVFYKNEPLNTKMIARNNYINHIVAKKNIEVDVGNGDIASAFNGSNIFVKAAKLTLQNLGLQTTQLGQVVNLSSQTLRALPFDNKTTTPSTIVVLGKNVDNQLEKTQEDIVLKDNIGSLQQAMGSSFYTLYRGIEGLGLSHNQLFKSMFDSVSDHVRGHKDTKSSKRYLTSGEQVQEIEVLTNPVITPKDLLDSGILGVFLEFAQNIHSLESEQKAYRDATMHFAIPSYKTDGLNTTGNAEIISEDNLGVFTNVRGKNVTLVSTEGSVTVGSGIVRNYTGENYSDTLVRTHIEAEDNLLIQGKTDVNLKAIETKSGLGTKIVAQTGMVVDESLATIDYTVTHTCDEDSSTTTKVTNVHQNVSAHQSNGTVNIKAKTGILQQGSKNTNVKLRAPIIIQDDVHDQRFVESVTESHKKSGGFFGSLFNIRETKTTNFSSSSSISNGCHNNGKSFIAKANERFKAVNPTFAAKINDITANEIEIKAGTNSNQSQTQSIFKGMVWNKINVSTENHITHQNPTFENNVYLHSKKVILEKVRGSKGTFDKIISDSEIIFKDIDDKHESTNKSQKSLTAGAALVLSLAVTMATGNPLAASSIPSAMLNAGYGTLCSQAAICLVEQNGDPNKAITELGKRDIGKTLAISMTTAGLTKGIGDKLGVTNSTEFTNLAKKHLIQSSINTAMSVAIDGQSFDKAMLQGITSATINTLTAYGASKIGDARNVDNNRIEWGTHKLLHGILGGLGGGLSSQLSGGKFEEGLKSGAFGAVMAETLAETIHSKGDDQNKRERTGELAKFLATSLAFGTGLDPIIAYQTASNAIEHNFKMHPDVRLCLEDLGIIDEEPAYGEGEDERTKEQQAYERGRDKYVKDSLNQAKATRKSRALSKDTYDLIVENADIFYARSYWSGEANGYMLEASTYIPGTTGLFMGVTEGIHGFATGKYDAAETVQSVVTSSMGVLGKGGKLLKSGMKLVEKVGERGPSSNVPELANKTDFKTVNHRPAEDNVFSKGLIKAPKEIDGTKFGKLFEKHHIISNKNKATKDHKLLDLAGFDLNSKSNIMLLPTKKGFKITTTDRSIHDGNHIDLVSKRLAGKMEDYVKLGNQKGWGQPEYHKALVEIIAEEKAALKAGDRILNKNHRPKATDDGRVIPKETKK